VRTQDLEFLIFPWESKRQLLVHGKALASAEPSAAQGASSNQSDLTLA